MALNYGHVTKPESWMIGLLIPLGLPVGAEREELTSLPGYVVHCVSPTDDKVTLEAVVSVHSFAASYQAGGQGMSQANTAAWNAHDLIIGCTPGDTITLPGGGTVPGAWVDVKLAPTYSEYRDPEVKRYVARYCITLRYS